MEKMDHMQKAWRAQFIKNLMTTKLPQNFVNLVDNSGSVPTFCALGVGLMEFVKDRTHVLYNKCTTSDELTNILDINSYLGITKEEENAIITLNDDHHFSFLQIAKAVEKNQLEIIQNKLYEAKCECECERDEDELDVETIEKNYNDLKNNIILNLMGDKAKGGR